LTNSAELVSVVVPVYNAARTLDEALRSVRAQTWSALDIIVVDDGSTDDSAAIASLHADADRRVRILSQRNRGVAAARNSGIAAAAGEFVAMLDADDLWHPSKIQRQMEVMAEGGDDVGLSYTGYAVLDEFGRIQGPPVLGAPHGMVLKELCRENFIGNGSSVLFRKAALVSAGGYDPGLREANAQGCEDLQLYLRIAERYSFAMVPESLTGYRLSSTTMTCDALQMFRSISVVLTRTVERHPELKDDAAVHLANATSWFIYRALATGRLVAAERLYREARRRGIALALLPKGYLLRQMVISFLPLFLRRRISHMRQRPNFSPVQARCKPKPRRSSAAGFEFRVPRNRISERSRGGDPETNQGPMT